MLSQFNSWQESARMLLSGNEMRNIACRVATSIGGLPYYLLNVSKLISLHSICHSLMNESEKCDDTGKQLVHGCYAAARVGVESTTFN